MSELITKHEINMGGEEIDPDVYDVRTEQKANVIFNDEYVGEINSGNIACSIYDEWETAVNDAGYEILDTDGNVLTVQPIKQG